MMQNFISIELYGGCAFSLSILTFKKATISFPLEGGHVLEFGTSAMLHLLHTLPHPFLNNRSSNFVLFLVINFLTNQPLVVWIIFPPYLHTRFAKKIFFFFLAIHFLWLSCLIQITWLGRKLNPQQIARWPLVPTTQTRKSMYNQSTAKGLKLGLEVQCTIYIP